MLENSVRWRRDYRPDELDPEYIKPEVIINHVYWEIIVISHMVACYFMGLTQFFFSGARASIFYLKKKFNT
jgi:hypothetical protein